MNNDEARAAYIVSQSACAMARIAGMQAENAHRQSCGNGIAYGEDAFAAIENEFCISHNAVVEFLRAGR
jgi:hypothetical protein